VKIAIITSICGLNSKLTDPEHVYADVDYIAFVDKPHDVSIWEQRDAYDFTLDTKYEGRRNAKIYKIVPQLFLPEYDYYFWVDATHEVIQNPHDIIRYIMKDSEIGLFKHTDRCCVYDEADILLQLGYDYPNLIKDQMEYYRGINYPPKNGLYELPVSIRKNCYNINRMNLRWWELICRYSSRDQISLPFVIDGLGIEPTILEGYANGGLNANPIMPQVRYKGR
jgi:hypothetical protein